VSGLTHAQEWGLVLAAPVGAVLFLTSVVLTFLTRVGPSMNLFSIGSGLRVGIGLAAVYLLLPDFMNAMLRTIAYMSGLLGRMV
jgi:flagellar biosynthesis protein FliR